MAISGREEQSEGEERPDAALVGLPQTKAECQRVLRRLGYTGLKIDAIDTDRVYVLTGRKLHLDNTMRRQAQTLVFTLEGATVRVTRLDGWVV